MFDNKFLNRFDKNIWTKAPLNQTFLYILFSFFFEPETLCKLLTQIYSCTKCDSFRAVSHSFQSITANKNWNSFIFPQCLISHKVSRLFPSVDVSSSRSSIADRYWQHNKCSPKRHFPPITQCSAAFHFINALVFLFKAVRCHVVCAFANNMHACIE